MKKNILHYSDFISTRSSWMDFAMLWIMLFHAYLPIGPKVITDLFSIGYGGVDIFFFASGIGCWYSLNKNDDYYEFLKRRVKRIYPAYLPVIIAFIVFNFIIKKYMSASEILGNIFCIGYFFGEKNQFNWYLGALFIFYLLTPVFVKFINKNINDSRKLLLSFTAVVLFSFCFFNNSECIVAFSRLPIAFLGIVFAAIGNSKDTSFKNVIISILLMCVGIVSLLLCYKYLPKYLWSHGLHWYPFILITPGLCYVISFVVSKCRVIEVVLSFIGEYSFEIYLIHVLLFYVIKMIYGLSGIGFTLRMIAFVASFGLAFIYNKMIRFLTDSFERKRAKKLIGIEIG